MPDTTVIAPEGELDIAHLMDFRDALSEAANGGAARVIVDLTLVSFIDSSGLGALVDMHNRLRRNKRQLALVAPRGTGPAVLMELAGLRGTLPIFDTREAAVET